MLPPLFHAGDGCGVDREMSERPNKCSSGSKGRRAMAHSGSIAGSDFGVGELGEQEPSGTQRGDIFAAYLGCPMVAPGPGVLGQGRTYRTTIASVYCPKCGESMMVIEDRWECPVGEMRLSEKMQGLIDDWSSAPPVSEDQLRKLTFRIGGDWWCPFDGEKVHWSDQYPSCPSCGRTLTMAEIHPLVELHPHKG